MPSGKIKKLVRDRAFGFISVPDSKDIFFHQNSLVDIKFEDLNEGQGVEFETERSPKGVRAVNIRVVK